jgi:uncharacterized FlaG/YvyC family protein
MAITGLGSAGNYTPYRATRAASEDNAASNRTRTEAAQSENQTEPKTRTVAEYTAYLQDKFDHMNSDASIEGVPVSVSVSPAFLRKAANDPEAAKFLEENLAAIPDATKNSVAKATADGRVLTSQNYSFDANGHVAIATTTTNDPDGSIARENAERKTKEAKEKEEAADKKSAEKKKAEKQAEERSEEKLLVERLAEKMAEKLAKARDRAADRSEGSEEFVVSSASDLAGTAVGTYSSAPTSESGSFNALA